MISQKHLCENRSVSFGAESKPGSYMLLILEAKIGGIAEQGLRTFDQLHICIKVDTAVLIDDLQPDVVRDKSPFFCLIGLANIEGSGRNVVV